MIETSPSDMAAACGQFYDQVMSGDLVHTGQPHLDAALAGARKRSMLNGAAWGWNRKSTSTDITPLVAASLAAQMSAGGSEPLPELDGLDVRWRDPSTPSRAAATDAVMKQVAAGVVPADSDVALEQVGYDEATISRIAEHRRVAGPSGAARLADALTRAKAPGGGTDPARS